MDPDTKQTRIPVEFSTALRACRHVRGYTVREVAKGAGVSTWDLLSFERGEAIPSPQEFAKIWQFLTTDPPLTAT
jgi:hypothetical protein